MRELRINAMGYMLNTLFYSGTEAPECGSRQEQWVLYPFRVLLVHTPVGYLGLYNVCRKDRSATVEAWRRDGERENERRRDLCLVAAVASEPFARVAGRRRKSSLSLWLCWRRRRRGSAKVSSCRWKGGLAGTDAERGRGNGKRRRREGWQRSRSRLWMNTGLATVSGRSRSGLSFSFSLSHSIPLSVYLSFCLISYVVSPSI